ncbi:MAG: MarC family protein [Gammaproteobacteria bacterium]|nr:MarC family protein [Gammaproteobacteria bacterium]
MRERVFLRTVFLQPSSIAMSLDQWINALIVMFVVLDPPGTAAIFAALTRGGDSTYRRRMAIKAVLLSTGILFVFTFIGSRLLHALSVGLPAFKIAGGILLFLIAIDMIFARQSGLRSATVREQEEARFRDDISVFPLAFPLIAGPGSLTTVILLAGNTHGDVWAFVSVLIVIAIMLVITLVSLLASGLLMRVLGVTGSNVLGRLFGVLLAAMAVQFVIDGVLTSLPPG